MSHFDLCCWKTSYFATLKPNGRCSLEILDYAETSKVEWSATSLAKEPKLSKHAEWIQKSRRQIDTMLATNDILLVIAGDEISESLLRLARRFAASDEPTNLSELCLVSMALYRRGAERLLIPHVVSAVQRYQRQATVRITVAGQAPEEHVISVTRDRDADVEAKLRGTPQTNIAARIFLEKAKSKLEPEASAPQYEVTRKLRKLLEYCPSAAESRLGYKIHFGGYVTDSWSPIEVGLFVQSETNRDGWSARIKAAIDAQKLPPGTKMLEAGQQTVSALVQHDWSDPEQLTDDLMDEILAELRMFMSTFKDVENEP